MPVYVGSYSSDDIMQVWFISKLPIAKETLSRFPTLNTLLNSFSGYETKLYRNTRNSVMFLCLPRFEGDNGTQIQRLEKIERTLNLLQIEKWPLGKYNAFKSRITNEHFDESFSAQTEIEAVADMLSIVNGGNLTLYPELEHGRYSDVQLVLDGQTIYIEIGNLSQSLPENKINKILLDCAEHLGKQVSHSHLQIMVDTAGFKFSDNDVLDDYASIEQLNSEIDGLKLSQLAGYEGFFEISHILWLLENKDLFKKFTFERENLDDAPLFVKLIEISNNPIAQNWINSLDLNELQKAKIVTGVIGSSLPKDFPLLVEIHTEGLYPSQAGRAGIQSFINHLIRHVINQLPQIQPHAPNIVAVRVSKFMLTSLSLFAEIGNLQREISQLFDKIKNEHILGIALYHDSLKNAVFFNNPFVGANSRINDGQLAKLGFHSPTIKDFLW